MKSEISERDRTDSERIVSPLKQAEDAMLIDTTSMSIDEVAEKISQTCRKEVRPMNLYPLGKFLVSTIFYPLYRVKVIGKENFPKEGGVLLCANHIDNLDPPVVGMTCPRPVHFMAKEELFKVPILKSILPSVKHFLLNVG